MDKRALTNPTRRKSRRSQQGAPQRTIEETTWPDESRVLSIMAHGFTYDEAWHMGWRDYHRYSALAAAWSIPYDEREATLFKPTAADVDRYT